MKRSGPIARKSPLKRGSKRLKPASANRSVELKKYYELRQSILFERSRCEMPGCHMLARDVHHKAGRGPNLNNTATWMCLCRRHHEQIHESPTWARAMGYLFMSNNASSSSGIGFIGLLTILFIALKLTHVIDWRWLWILAPLWISAGIALIVCFIAFLIYAILSK